MRFARILLAMAAGILSLSACEPVAIPAPEPIPVAVVAPKPRPPAPAPPPAQPQQPSAESEALALYYRRLQADLLSQGLLRGDGGGTDTPFTDSMLARNFVNIALFDEYAPDTGTQVSSPRASRLRRWDGPIRLGMEFGPSVSPAQATKDRDVITTYAARLSRLTDVPIEVVGTSAEDADFSVLVLNEDEREASGARLRELVPGIADSSVRAVTNLPRSTLCLVIAFSDGDGVGYGRAVAVIRAEHPDLLRSACVHEELAQGMGLANDSPHARPSIFNDDEEFALLTRHDELLLRMLYDDRLRTGMAAEEALPVVSAIAAELMGGS